MRYVLSLAILVMFMLVACPQQRIPQPIVPGSPDNPSKTATLVPATFTQPPALNPGNLTIELLPPQGDNIIVELKKDSKGVPQYRINLTTDVAWPWKVQASAKDISADNILLDSFPNYASVTAINLQNQGGAKVQRYQFYMKYDEGQIIEPKELFIVARNIEFCQKVVYDNKETGVKEVDGVMPDILNDKSDCNKMGDGNIYNFDQKLRLHLQVENVPNEAQAEADEQQRLRKEMLYCTVINASKKEIVTLAKKSWSTGNIVLDLFKNIGIDYTAALFNYKVSIGGYDCNQEQYQVKNNPTTNPNRQRDDTGGNDQPLGPGF